MKKRKLQLNPETLSVIGLERVLGGVQEPSEACITILPWQTCVRTRCANNECS